VCPALRLSYLPLPVRLSRVPPYQGVLVPFTEPAYSSPDNSNPALPSFLGAAFVCPPRANSLSFLCSPDREKQLQRDDGSLPFCSFYQSPSRFYLPLFPQSVPFLNPNDKTKSFSISIFSPFPRLTTRLPTGYSPPRLPRLDPIFLFLIHFFSPLGLMGLRSPRPLFFYTPTRAPLAYLKVTPNPPLSSAVHRHVNPHSYLLPLFFSYRFDLDPYLIEPFLCALRSHLSPQPRRETQCGCAPQW